MLIYDPPTETYLQILNVRWDIFVTCRSVIFIQIKYLITIYVLDLNQLFKLIMLRVQKQNIHYFIQWIQTQTLLGHEYLKHWYQMQTTPADMYHLVSRQIAFSCFYEIPSSKAGDIIFKRGTINTKTKYKNKKIKKIELNSSNMNLNYSISTNFISYAHNYFESHNNLLNLRELIQLFFFTFNFYGISLNIIS